MKQLNKGDEIPKIKYTFEKEWPLSRLEKHSDHRRLRVFHFKGTECSNPNCSRVGTRFIVGLDRGGNRHMDVYTDDLVLMTIDHFVPKAKGGDNSLENTIPMCQPCNSWKANRFEGLEGFINPEIIAPKEKKKDPNAKAKKHASMYGRSWRKTIRRTKRFDFYGQGDMLVGWRLVERRKLHAIR